MTFTPLPHVALNDPHVAAHNLERDTLNTVGASVDTNTTKNAKLQNGINQFYRPKQSYSGVATTDVPTVTTGAGADGTFNEGYTLSGNALPAIWPVDAYGKMSTAGNNWTALTASSSVSTVTTFRFMMDGTDLVFMTNASAGFDIDLFVDGKPYGSNPIIPAVSTGFAPYGYQKLIFTTAKPRLIELRMIGGLVLVATKKPYRIWRPSPDLNPKIAVVGDSYVYPTVMSDTASGSAAQPWLHGMWQEIPALLGLTSLVTDGVGGTGYINPGGSSSPYNATARLQWLVDTNPDVIVVHGGGCNDLFGGNTVAATITAATAYFTTIRAAHPNAKLIFMEGFSPPGFTPATYNPNFVSIRQGVQTNLVAAGIDAYYVDIATTRPPLNGSGYVTATNASGNSDIYVGSDSYHPTVKGHTYCRNVIAPKIARILADNGPLVNQLVL